MTSGVSQVAETKPLSFSNYDVAMVELLNNGHTAVSLSTFSVRAIEGDKEETKWS